MTAPTAHDQWETVIIQLDQSLALAKVLRELFIAWEDEHMVGTTYHMHGVPPGELRAVTDLLTRGMEQASDLLGPLEPSCSRNEVAS